MASLAATPASRFRTPEPVEEKTTLDTYGLRLLPGFEPPAPAGASSRTSPAICRSEDTKSPEAFKAWATRLRKSSLQRRKSAPLTDANASSSSPTAMGYAAKGRPPGHTELDRRVIAWPTPRSSDTNGAGQHGQGGADLRKTTQNWQTPTSAAEAPNLGSNIKRGPKSLLAQAQWATPAARDVKGSYSREALTRKDGKDRTNDLLPTQAEYHLDEFTCQACGYLMETDDAYGCPNCEGGGLPPLPMSTGGDESSPSAPTSRRRLNPTFVEGLMGWPLGWTSLVVTDCESWATVASRHRLPTHGDSSGESSGSSGPVETENWPTPRARDHHVEGVNSDDEKVYSPSLARVVERNWTTPTAGDGAGGQTEPSEARRKGGGDRSLRVDAAQWEPPGDAE